MDTAHTPAPPRLRAALTGCVILTTLMQALDSTIANVALPTIQGALAATPDRINWVLTAYLAAAAVVMPATGFLEARLGRRRLFLLGVAGFVAASMACGAATSLGQMVAFRALQGAFGAPLVPLAQSVLLDLYRPEERGRAMAWFGIGVMMGPVIGPALGGWLTETQDWRWVFYVNLPVGILAFVGLAALLPRAAPRRDAPFDLFGFASLGLAVAALQVMLDRGQQLDWFASAEIRAAALVVLAGAWFFAVQTLTARRPFLAPALFADRNLVVGLGLTFLLGTSLMASLALLTPFLEDLQNEPVLTAGLLTAPRGIGTMLTMLLVGRLVGRVDARLLVALGFLVTAWALHGMSRYTADTSQWEILRGGLVQGLGFGIIWPSLSTLAFATLAPELRTQGTGLYSLLRNIGSSIGISVTSVLLVREAAVLHAGLAAHVTPYAAAVREHAGLLGLGTLRGRAAVDALLQQQASVIAYSDAFLLLAGGALLGAGLVFLARRPPGGGTAPAAAAAEG